MGGGTGQGVEGSKFTSAPFGLGKNAGGNLGQGDSSSGLGNIIRALLFSEIELPGADKGAELTTSAGIPASAKGGLQNQLQRPTGSFLNDALGFLENPRGNIREGIAGNIGKALNLDPNTVKSLERFAKRSSGVETQRLSRPDLVQRFSTPGVQVSPRQRDRLRKALSGRRF